MRQIISIYIIQQLLYFTSKVESLIGPKIIRARNGEFPFVASIQYYPEGTHFCTGSLITRKYVITAAHCLEGETTAGIKVVFGIVSLQNTTVFANYTVASMTSYDDWVRRLRIQKEAVTHDIAVIELKNRVTQPNVRPIRLNELSKKQIQGKTAIIIGWNDDAINQDFLNKATVKILSDEDCERNIRLITNDLQETHSRTLCTAATPYAIVKCGDSGGPIIDEHNRLLGVNFGECPDPAYAWGNFSDEFLQKYQVNLHFSVDYYRQFIVNVTGYL